MKKDKALIRSLRPAVAYNSVRVGSQPNYATALRKSLVFSRKPEIPQMPPGRGQTVSGELPAGPSCENLPILQTASEKSPLPAQYRAVLPNEELIAGELERTRRMLEKRKLLTGGRKV
jgi:hypothetical protein